MATFAPYTPDEYAVDAPATADHFKRWFENCVAIAEAAPGAPRIVLPAFERLAAGEQIRSRSDVLATAGTSTPVKAFSFGFFQHGFIRLQFTQIGNVGASGTGRAAVQRIRAGAALVLQNFDLGGENLTAVRNIDCSVIPGDEIAVTIARIAGNGTSQVNNFRLKTNGQNLFPGVAVHLEGNENAS